MRRLASWGLVGWVLVALAAGLLLSTRNGTFSVGSSLIDLAMASFTVLGVLILSHHPHNRLGVVLAAIGFLWTTGELATQAALYAYRTLASPFSGAWVLAWYAEWYWIPSLLLIFVFTLLLFPDGRLASPSWRPAAWLAALIGVCFTVLSAFGRQLTLPRDLTLPNPLGVLPIHNVEEGITGALLAGSFLVLVLVAVASLIRRFRASRGVERQQLKWFAYAATVLVMGFILQGLVDATIGRRLVVVDAILLALVPLSIAIAILRYRLYDIDLVINRTLVYGSLTALLAAVYVGGVVGLPRLLPLGEGNDLAVAGSTLTVAALFSPARRRIQAFVDRRFYRSRYDAQRTVEAFSTRLRDEVDLEDLLGGLTSVVRETLQPASVGVWLRRPEAVRLRDSE